MATATATAQRTGKVVQVIGPVIDVEFAGGLPEISVYLCASVALW